MGSPIHWSGFNGAEMLSAALGNNYAQKPLILAISLYGDGNTSVPEDVADGGRNSLGTSASNRLKDNLRSIRVLLDKLL